MSGLGRRVAGFARLDTINEVAMLAALAVFPADHFTRPIDMYFVGANLRVKDLCVAGHQRPTPVVETNPARPANAYTAASQAADAIKTVVVVFLPTAPRWRRRAVATGLC